MTSAPRYAVYWTPSPAHPLWRAGCRWLGRDPDDEQRVGQPTSPQRAAPWRYGFHATLCAPIRLTAGASEADLLLGVATVAARHAPFELPRLQVDALDDFVALRPAEPLGPDHILQRLADDCVRTLNALRAPLDAEEQRRRAGGLTEARSLELLAIYGYPHVLERWRFHLTLTGPLPDRDRRHWAGDAHEWFRAALSSPPACEALSVFREDLPRTPLRLLTRLPLAREPRTDSQAM